MSFQTYVMARLNQLIEFRNQVTANSKRIDELPTATAGIKSVAVWNATAEQTQKQARDAFVDQNNIGYKYALPEFSLENPMLEVVQKINTVTITINEKQTPVIIYALEFIPSGGYITKHEWLFMAGKGVWGSGGVAVNASHLYMLPSQAVVVSDINPDATTEIIDLGAIFDEGYFLATANGENRDFSDPDMTYYFSYYVDDILYIARFIGEPGIYGEEADQDFVDSDFANVTNSAIQPGPAIPNIQQVLTAGYTASNPQLYNFVTRNGLMAQLHYGKIIKAGKGYTMSMLGVITPNDGAFDLDEKGDFFWGCDEDGYVRIPMRWDGIGDPYVFTNQHSIGGVRVPLPDEPGYEPPE